MNWLIKQIAKITLLGKLVEKLGPKVPIIFVFISLIFAAFYIPYEYENILEFKLKYPNDVIGLSLNLARPTIIILILLILIFSAFSAVNERKRQLEEEEQEQKQKESEALARRQEALRKLEELKKSPVAKTAEAIVTKKSIGTLGGAAIGATLGGSLGIAGKFLGAMVFINGAWVLAPVGGVLGYFAAKKLAKKKEEKLKNEKIKKEHEEKINQETKNK
tara:strand:+ start:2350 stop:3006 length:657 start_codon:yes stop_codon:yes gene_type:complete